MARFHFPTPKACNSGSPLMPEYIRVDDPRPHLVKTADTDFDAYIQSFAEEADYVSILEKMMKGDPVASAKATVMLGGNGRAIPTGYVDDSKSFDLKTLHNSIASAHELYEKLGGTQKLGMTFEDFLRNFDGFEYGKPNESDPAPAESAPVDSSKGDEK